MMKLGGGGFSAEVSFKNTAAGSEDTGFLISPKPLRSISRYYESEPRGQIIKMEEISFFSAGSKMLPGHAEVQFVRLLCPPH